MGNEVLVGIGADFSAMEAARQKDAAAWKAYVAQNKGTLAELTRSIEADGQKLAAANAAALAKTRAQQTAYKTQLSADAVLFKNQMPLESWGSPSGGNKSDHVGLRGLRMNAEHLAVLLSGGLGAGIAVMAFEKLSQGFEDARRRTADFRRELEELRHSNDTYGREGLGGIVGLNDQRAKKMREMDRSREENNADVFARFYNPTAWWKYQTKGSVERDKRQIGREYDSQIEKMAGVQVEDEEHKLQVIRAQAEGRAADAKWLETEYELNRKIAEAEKLGYGGPELVSVYQQKRAALRGMSERDNKMRGLETQGEAWRENVLRDSSLTSEYQRQLELLRAQLNAQQAITEAAQTAQDRQRGKTREAELELQIQQAISNEAERKRMTRAQRAEDEAGKKIRLADLDSDFERQMILNDRTPGRKIRASLFQADENLARYNRGSFDPIERAQQRNRLAGDLGGLQDMRFSLLSKPTISDDITKIGGGGYSYAGADSNDMLRSIDEGIKAIAQALSPKTVAPNAVSISTLSN